MLALINCALLMRRGSSQSKLQAATKGESRGQQATHKESEKSILTVCELLVKLKRAAIRLRRGWRMGVFLFLRVGYVGALGREIREVDESMVEVAIYVVAALIISAGFWLACETFALVEATLTTDAVLKLLVTPWAAALALEGRR